MEPVDKGSTGESISGEAQTGPNTEVGHAGAPAIEAPREAPISGTPQRRTEVEIATASMPAHGAPAVKLEPAEASSTSAHDVRCSQRVVDRPACPLGGHCHAAMTAGIRPRAITLAG
jgi:hypothetical protein